MKNRPVGILLLLLAAGVFASDAEAPLTVEAGSMLADRASEISVFRDDVRIDKGTIRIEAEEARLRAVEGEVREGTLLGDPVRFRQKPEDAPLIEGEAKRIEYDAVNRVVELTGNAWVRQGTDEFRGETIRYHLDARKVLATSGESVPERVKITFQPKSAEESDKKTGN
jgi:lipopolysaccharide export system protein LptA